MDSDDWVHKDFLECLPNENWIFEQSLQQNEMFVLGLSADDYEKALKEKDYALLNQHLYRVQSISSSDYYFRYHLETKIDNTESQYQNALNIIRELENKSNILQYSVSL